MKHSAKWKTRPKTLHILYYLCKMSRISKFIEVEYRLMISRGWGRGKRGVATNGPWISLGLENILELNSGDGCKSLLYEYFNIKEEIHKNSFMKVSV